MTFSLFKRLLPNGRAWAVIAAKRLRQFFEGLAAGASDPVVKEFDDRFDDLNPQLTTQLAQWESQFNLINTGLTEQERRDRLQGAWSAVGGQSPRYIQDTLQAAGFGVYVHEWWEPGGTTTAGDSFTDLGAQFGNTPNGVACSVDGAIVYVIDNGDDSLYRSTNSGASFTNLGQHWGDEAWDVACSADGSIVYVTDQFDVTLSRSADFGVSFTDLGNPTNGTPWGVAASDDGTIVYVTDADDDKLFRSANSGDSFTDLGSAGGSNPTGVACSADGATVFVADISTDNIYRSTDSGDLFTDLGAPGGSNPEGVACSADGAVVFVVDSVTDSIYRSIGTISPVVIGSVNGDPVPVVRDPHEYIVDANTIPQLIGSGHELAYCGGDSFFSNAQEIDGPQGYLLVNKISQADGLVGSGHDLAYCGGDSAASGVSEPSLKLKQYVIPDDPTKYPYFLYIGAATFPAQATLPASRRDEFEDLCLKICPAQQWLGILVSYT